MITINSAMQQENIKALLAAIDQDGITYTFKEKKGIALFFGVTGDKEAAIRLAKDAIKAEDWGRVLYFNVV
jgi:hypothetical protein